VNDSFYKRLGELEVLTDEELQEVSDILDRLIKASLEAEEPQEKPTTKTMHHAHPETEYALLARIDMQLDDLRAFRDDAHIASWRPYEVDGRTWESLSFIWQGEANSASKLKELLPFRGYEEDDYAKSLTKLVELGLIKKGDDGFALSSKGESLRLEAEETTDRVFFKPWQVLEDNEQTRLRNLLIRMKINLENLAKTEAELASA
jgi:DNA-binding MarR family transcriptional regulator